jgi:alpha-L-arabinofuranosidase
MMSRRITAILIGAFMVIAGGSLTQAADSGAGLPPRGASLGDPGDLFGGGAPATLPDGTVPAPWDKPASYSRTCVVDQHSPDASDTGEGTAEHPFRTIGRAAEVVGPGERVLVKAGIYRDEVQPRRGGEGPDRMVTFEAEPGQAVIIRGSCIVPRSWQVSARSPASTPASIWTLRLPESQFAEYNPFAFDNLDERDGHTHSWESTGGSASLRPYRDKRGLLFHDGRRLAQISRYDDLADGPGACWVDAGGWQLYAHLFGDADPNGVLMEATNRKQCFAPAQPGVSYLRLKGFIIEQVGNAFSYPVEAAV